VSIEDAVLKAHIHTQLAGLRPGVPVDRVDEPASGMTDRAPDRKRPGRRELCATQTRTISGV
jgi:hypothetical protein